MDETMDDREITELLYSDDPQGPVQLDTSREDFIFPARSGYAASISRALHVRCRGRHMGAFPCKHGRHPVARRLTKYRSLCESIALHVLGNREDAEESASDALMKVSGSIPPEKPPKMKKDRDTIRYFDLDQAQRFLDFIETPQMITVPERTRKKKDGTPYKIKGYTKVKELESKYRVFFLLALFCGCRWGELLALTWDDVDLENRTLSISKSTEKVRGQVITKDPKSETSIRVVPMRSFLRFPSMDSGIPMRL